MIKKLDLIQGTDDWLKFRLSRLGASEVSAAIGQSPWRKPKSLFLEKTKGITPDNKSKQQLFELGHSKEIIARKKYEDLTLKRFFPVVITNDDYPYLSASLDGLSDDGELIEIKYLGLNDYMDVALGLKIPDKYMPQVQIQMALAEVDIMTFIGINEADFIATFKVTRDSEYIDEMVKKLNAFWNKVLNNNWDLED